MKTAIHAFCSLAFLAFAVPAVNAAETDWPQASSAESVFFPEPGEFIQASWSYTTYEAAPPAAGARHCPHSCGHGLWARDHLLGDWLGARPGLAQHGIIADLQLTQFYQGVTGGGVDE